MPHVQVLGEIRVGARLAAALAPLLESQPPLVLKVLDAYVNPSEKQMILEALVVEDYLRQRFFLLVHQEEDGVLIRCHPAAPVQKTDGVKQLIALLGRKCLAAHPRCRIGNTNLSPLLADLLRPSQ
jgi:hypothetical protein